MRDERAFSLIEVLVALFMMGVLAAVVTLPLRQEDERASYEKTVAAMEEIRTAVLGRPGLYCNGQRQFTGYVADMGGLPALVDEKGAQVSALALEQEGETNLCFAQPRALWTRDINGDGDTHDPADIPEDFLWKYYEEERIWAGWRGPYLAPPPDGVLRDGWGHPFLFAEGEIVTFSDPTDVEKVYRAGRWYTSKTVPPGTYHCIKDWAFPGTRSLHSPPPPPGFDNPYDSRWDDCWEALPADIRPPVIEPRENFNRFDTYRVVVTNLYYGEGTLCVVSYGSDGEPGGEGYARDIIMTIYRNEWSGEVAGMVGNDRENYVNSVSICYPRFEPGEDRFVEWRHEIPVALVRSEATGKNFRFGRAYPLKGQTVDPSWQEVDIPMGIRSLRARAPGHSDGVHVFAIEPTGNFIGTLRRQ